MTSARQGATADEDEPEVCILDGNEPLDDDQTCDDIEMVDPSVVEAVGRAGLDDTGPFWSGSRCAAPAQGE